MRLLIFLSLIFVASGLLRPLGDIAEIVCHQPKVVGPCKARFHRFYYSFDKNECIPFIYGGCGKNDNNFETKEDCWFLCGR
ncbi:kunitz-type serine protease inhibitor HCRG2-like [Penaeus monodon]|uniref:kunitz-type serine protease inhibitor HCRG2-like n=1 Tax=Penaeus monodon TaxID=6687 RepID=UPI0018A7D3C0|nr:kunitz-type serine protease inhibitor HCRG2-like [Penaeus monodon]